MAKSDKVAAVADLKDRFAAADAVVLTEYRGLSVIDLKNLRRSLGAETNYAIAKNTLAKLAAKDAGIDGLDSFLVGPTAFAFISGDIASAAKGLRDFAKTNAHLVLKAGFMDGKVLDAAAVKALADLESREVLLAKLAGALKGTATKAAGLFAASLTQAAQLMAALQTKKEETAPVAEVVEESSAASADETEAAEELPAVEEPPAEVAEEIKDAAEAASEKE